MNLQLEDANLISVFVRELKENKSYEDFLNAWKPVSGFGFPVRVINAVSQSNEKEILSIGFMKLDINKMDETLMRISKQEAIRHEMLSGIIESTALKGIYIIKDDNDLS